MEIPEIDSERLKQFNYNYHPENYSWGFLWPMIIGGEPSENALNTGKVLDRMFSVTKTLEYAISESNPMAVRFLEMTLRRLAEVGDLDLYGPIGSDYTTSTAEPIDDQLNYQGFISNMVKLFEEIPTKDGLVQEAHDSFIEMFREYEEFLAEPIDELLKKYV